jgi:hypothetical protein
METSLPANLRKPRLRRCEASTYLALRHGVTLAPATLAKLAVSGTGPAFQRMNRSPLYATDELDRWVASRLGAPTSNTTKDSQ